MSQCRLHSRVQSLEGIALTFPTNRVLKGSSALIINTEIEKPLITIQKTITYACTIDRTKCKFHWTSVWLQLFLFHSLGSTNFNISRGTDVISHRLLWNRGKDFQHVESTLIETLEKCNTKLLVFNTRTTTVDSSVWLAGNSIPTSLGQLFSTDQKQLGKGLGSSWEGSTRKASERISPPGW